MNNIKHYAKEHVGTFGLSLVAFLIVGSWFWSGVETLVLYPEKAVAATTSAVTVSASITATISCATDQSSTAFGTLTSSVITTSTPNTSSTISCANSGLGCTLYVKDAGNAVNGGLATTSPAFLIRSPNAAGDATSTLVAGTAGYGIRATSTSSGNGATLGFAVRYLRDADGINSVGGLSITNLTIASTTATSSSREVVVTHKSAISTVTPAGSYVDTITYECTAN